MGKTIDQLTDAQLDETFKKAVQDELKRKEKEGQKVAKYDSEKDQMYYLDGRGERVYV